MTGTKGLKLAINQGPSHTASILKSNIMNYKSKEKGKTEQSIQDSEAIFNP